MPAILLKSMLEKFSGEWRLRMQLSMKSGLDPEPAAESVKEVANPIAGQAIFLRAWK